MSDSKADELIRTMLFLFLSLAIIINLGVFLIVQSINSLSAKFPSPVTVASTECVAMSQEQSAKLLFTYLDKLWEDQRARYLNQGKFLDINMLDDLDPVHYRATQNTAAEFDYDGDMGREHSEYLRDNGIGGRQSIVAGTFVQIAAALPVIEAPSIVAEHPASEPVKSKTKG